MAKKKERSQLDIDASNAIKMGMSYGRYMGLVKSPVNVAPKKEKKKKPSGNCLCCGAELFWNGQGKEKKYCDDVCRELYYREKKQEKAAASVSATIVCKICGKEFPKNGHQAYCSEICVKRARADSARRRRMKKIWGE